ncbi:MAG TPA: C39 family peptidase [Methanothrix sp.]|nr:C39 family peptidase [Methanothrix sp.]
MKIFPFAFAMIVLLVAGSVAAGQSGSDGQEKVLDDFPSYSQGDTQWCAWVSAQMVLSYYGYSKSPQAVAVETFKLAGQTWGGRDIDDLPWECYEYYGKAIRSLSNNNLAIEEINTQNKNDIQYEIFQAIDRGHPIILLSNGPWLYDATDLPVLASFLQESSYPSEGHVSVIVGYSKNEEMNNFAPRDIGFISFFTNLLVNPPVVKIHDPSTANIGVGTYWVSYDKLFEKTIGSPSNTQLIIVKPSSGDSSTPITQVFRVSPQSLNIGESFVIDYTVSDSCDSGLKQVELWRKDETSDWQEIKRNTLSCENGPLSGSFTDSPPAPGTYWYGVHVVDNAGNWNDERNSNTNCQPVSFEPVEVEVTPVSDETVTNQCDQCELLWGSLDSRDDVIICYKNILKNDPENIDAILDMSSILLEVAYVMFDEDECFYYLNKALEIDPRNADAWYYKALALKRKGIEYDLKWDYLEDPDSFEDDFGADFELDFESIICYDKDQCAKEANSYWNEALECCNKAIELDPKDAYFLFLKGTILNYLGYDVEAEEAYNKTIELCDELIQQDQSPDRSQLSTIWHIKSEALRALGRNSEADEADTIGVEIVMENIAV